MQNNVAFIQNPDIISRDYQDAAIKGTRRFYDNEINRLLWIMATGTGKTIAFAMLPGAFPELAQFGMLIIVHTDELADQAINKIRLVNPFIRVGLEKADYRADPTSQVVVTSRQTLGRAGSTRLQRLMNYIKFGVVVVDEAHHVRRGGQYDNILNVLGLGSDRSIDLTLPNGMKRLLVGVTATPNRHDGVGLADFFDEIVCNYDLRYGITQGYLCDIEAYTVDTDVHLENIHTRQGDFAVDELEQATNTDHRNSIIVNAWKQYSNGPAIAFCTSVRHAHSLAACFNAADVPAMAVDGTTPDQIRKEIIRQYQQGEIMVLCNMGVLTEGFDAPHTDTILMARPTKSTSLYVQMLGRGTRTNPPDIGNLPTRDERLAAIECSDKKAMKLIDFVDVVGNHKLVTLPTLFGMPVKFKATGKKMVSQVVQKLEELERQNPMKVGKLRQASDFEELDVIASKVDLWDVASVTDDVKMISDLRWMHLPTGDYQLEVPAPRKFYVKLTEDTLGHIHASVTYPNQYVKSIGEDGTEISTYTPGQHIESTAVYRDLRSAINDLDNRIKARYREQINLMQHTPKWGRGVPTDGQIGLLKKLRVDFPTHPDGRPAISKGDASALISAALAMKRQGFKQPV